MINNVVIDKPWHIGFIIFLNRKSVSVQCITLSGEQTIANCARPVDEIDCNEKSYKYIFQALLVLKLLTRSVLRRILSLLSTGLKQLTGHQIKVQMGPKLV